MWNAYLAMGDSTTTGFGNWSAPTGSRSWTDLVAHALRSAEPDLRYRNIARNGTTASMLIRRQLPVLPGFRPGLVSVTVGANDARAYDWSAARFMCEYEHIVQLIDDAGARALTVTYPDIAGALAVAGRSSSPRWRLALRRLREVNGVIRDVSDRRGTLLLDLEDSDAASDPRYLSMDLTHPSAAGYRLAAEAALELLGGKLELMEVPVPP